MTMRYRQWKLWIWILAVLCALSACVSGGETSAAQDESAPQGESAAPENHADGRASGMDGKTNSSVTGKEKWKTVRLGSSLYAIRIAREFSPLRISNEDWEDDMAARYHHEKTLLDFSIYQFSKEGYADTLEAFVEEEAEEYEASEVVTDMEINGIAVAYYRCVQEYDGAERDGITLILEDGEEYLEVDFWFVGYQAEGEAWEITRSLTKIEKKLLPLGAYQIWIPEDFTPLSDETANPAVYENGSASLRLYIEHFPATGETLSEFVRGRGGLDISDIETGRTLHGIPAAFYRSVEALDGAMRSVWTCALAEPAGFLTLSFSLNGVTAEVEAEAILDTLHQAEREEA